MSEFLFVWLGIPALALVVLLLHLRYKTKFRTSQYYYHDTLMGAQCTCGEEMRVEGPQFILCYEDKQQAEEQVQYWISEHRKQHASAG